MLSEVEKELITSAIDGIITPEREEILRRLLLNSNEAALFYRDLIDQSRSLQALPRQAAPAGLSEAIFSRLHISTTPSQVETTLVREAKRKTNTILNDAAKSLISASVDGELSSEQASILDKLLSESPAAAVLHGELLNDRRRLKALPQVPVPATIAGVVMARVVRKSEPRPTRGFASRVAPYAVAASVLLTVTSLLWLASRFPKRDSVEITQASVREEIPPQPTQEFRKTEPTIVRKSNVVQVENPTTRPMKNEHVVALATPERAPMPRRPGYGEIVGFGPLNELQLLTTYHAKIPLLIPITEADKDEVREKIMRELAHDSLTRIDLFVPDTRRACEVLSGAAKKCGLEIQQDASIREWAKKPIVHLDLAIYTESLTAEETAKVLAELAARTRSEKKLPPPFTFAHLIPARPVDHQLTKALFAIDTSGGKPEPKSKSTLLPKKEKNGITTVYGPTLLRVRPEYSKDIIDFTEHRKHEERKPNTIPLLIVIRTPAQ